METVAQYFWMIGSTILTILGLLHLRGTFFTDMFLPKNTKVFEDMKSTYPNISKHMSMWNAWISFNATHSLAAIFMGLTNFYLAFRYFALLQQDHFFFLFSLASIAFILWLSVRYWFNSIRIGVAVVFACYCLAYVLMLLA